MAIEEVKLDEERQAQARAYSGESRRWMLAELVIDLILLLLILVSGFSSQLARWAERLANGNPWLTIALYGLVLFAAYFVISLPLSYLGGFRLAHRYGMSNQSLSQWAIDKLKGAAVTLVLGGLVIEIIYAILRWQPEWWWLLAALFMLFFTVLMGNLAPVLILPLFYNLTPLEDEELKGRLERLGERAGINVAGVFTINLSTKSPAANAMVMGLGKTRRIALGDTLYEDFTHEEIETIFAHELGHHVHGDLPKMIVVQSVLTLGGFWLADLFLTTGVNWFGFRGISDIGAFPLFVLAILLFSLITMPLANGFSRWREHLADRYALETMQEGGSMERAMTRLANQNLADVNPPRWVTFLLHSHPPLKERIEMARQYNR